MTERDRLIEELSNYLGFSGGYKFNYADKIADFILARDKRIVEPYVDLLRDIKFHFDTNGYKSEIQVRTDEILKNAAGVEL